MTIQLVYDESTEKSEQIHIMLHTLEQKHGRHYEINEVKPENDEPWSSQSSAEWSSSNIRLHSAFDHGTYKVVVPAPQLCLLVDFAHEV